MRPYNEVVPCALRFCNYRAEIVRRSLTYVACHFSRALYISDIGIRNMYQGDLHLCLRAETEIKIFATVVRRLHLEE